MHKLPAAVAALSVILAASLSAQAQTTAGTSAQIVVPITAQTASFASETTLYNPNAVAINVDVAFYEANNSTTPGLRTCADVAIPALRSIQFALATQCTLTAASHFGLLVLTELTGTKPFYGFARVQNPQGIGFSTEGFPAANFNNQVSHATGLKKTTTGLIYQTNCFVGSLSQAVASYTLKLFNDATGVQIGNTVTGSLAAFQQIRYLDIFGPAGVNALAGDQLNVRAEFASNPPATLVGFCTVQDNASFGADFRIAKSYGQPNAFVQGGNAFGTEAILGTSDASALDIRVNGSRAMRYEPNSISPNVIGGSPANYAYPGVRGATIAGGGVPDGDSDPFFDSEAPNIVWGHYGAIGGGYANSVGFNGTQTDSPFATVGGGRKNDAQKAYGTIGGGAYNTTKGTYATVGGGDSNVALGDFSAVIGGSLNHANGYASAVVGGVNNTAAGNFSFAAGYRATSNSQGCFTWADSTDTDYICNGANAFTARASGGVYFRTNAAATTGVNLTAGSGSWASASDRALKDNIAPVDPTAVLDRLTAVPIATWNYRAQQAGIRHMGPMAQDLYAAFGLGESDKTITSVDADGIALAAIQGLNAKVEAQARAFDEERALRQVQARELEAQRAEIATLRIAHAVEIAELKHAVEVLLARTSPEGRLTAR